MGIERRNPAPLVDGSLLHSGHVLTANVRLAIKAGMLGGTLYFTTLYLQVVLGYSRLAVGAAFAPITVVILLLSPRVGALVSTFGVRRLPGPNAEIPPTAAPESAAVASP